MLKIDKTQCMGCQLCADVCPVHAISYEFNNGFLYPSIDNKCISCGQCEKKCPAMNKCTDGIRKPEVYAAWTKNNAQRVNSTSGGICYELSKYIIDMGGYVAGVVWSNDYKDAHYEIVKDYDGLKRITQSKYFQPHISGIYAKIEEILKKEKLLLFIGTACTGEALRLFLGKEYNNLICCDFICRGYTSQLFHKKRVEELEIKYGSKVSHIQYKNKNNGWNNFGTLFEFENGKYEYVNRHDDSYEIMFQIDDYNTRPSCFECKYRGISRNSDITVGDFWGITHVSEDDLKKGVSVILINSTKGKAIFDAIKDKIVYEKREIYEVKTGNYALCNDLKMKVGADKFFTDLEERPLKYIEKIYAPRRKKTKMKKILQKLSDLLKCNIILFIKLNWFCKAVKRNKGKFIIPYKGAKVKIANTAKVFLAENIFLNTQKHANSKEEMYFTVNEKAQVNINGRVTIATGSTIDVLSGASLTMGRTDTNIGVVIVCSNNIEMGDDVQIGRASMIYDSNYHPTGFNKQHNLRPLKIGSHVWLCTGVTITKGLKIGNGAICGINSTIMSNVKEHSMVMGNPAKVIMTDVEW